MTAPILLFGPLGTPGLIWRGFERAMAPRVAIAFDVPAGFDVDLESSVDRVWQSVGCIGSAMDVVAVGFGSCLALGLAVEHPGAVRRLVLAAPTARPGNPDLWLARAAAVEADGWGPHAPSIVERWGGAPAERAEWAGLLATMDPRAYAAACSVAAHADLRPRLGQVRCPTLILAAGSDRALGPEHLEQVVGGITGARRALLPDAGHLAMLSDSFAPTVRAFLDRS